MIKVVRNKTETSPFMIATNNIKYLEVTLTKEVRNVYDKLLCPCTP